MSQPPDDELLRTARLAELGLMTASLAHELRQPLFAVKSLAQIAQSQLAGEGPCAALVRTLLDQVAHMERLTDDLCQYAREPGPQAGPVDCGATIEQAVAMLSHRARRKGVRLRAEVQVGLGAVVADPVGALQVLVNVLQNAIDASPDQHEVLIHASAEPRHVLVQVRDQGPGLAAGLAERVFEPFVTTKAPGEGTGLGLALCRRVMRDAGGEIRFDPVEVGAQVSLRWRAWDPSVVRARGE